MNVQTYKDKYHITNGKFVDYWMEGIKFLPFTSNPSNAFDKKCSLQGVTGEYFRLWEGNSTQPIQDIGVLKKKIESYWQSNDMSNVDIDSFCNIVKDVLFVDGNLNVTDSAFLKYLPYLPANCSLDDEVKKKYQAGEIKMANYLFSMRNEEEPYPSDNAHKNLFINVLREVFCGNSLFASTKSFDKYYVLPFIKASFVNDFK